LIAVLRLISKDFVTMQSDDPIERKVQGIFREFAGTRAAQLNASIPEAREIIAKALAVERGDEAAKDIAFHLTDWNSDAAFIVAALLCPERFTAEEIQEGVLDFLVHAPNHIAAAAKLADWPITDVFNVGALDGY
jgi:hypothetical protein